MQYLEHPLICSKVKNMGSLEFSNTFKCAMMAKDFQL